ncbi:MAG: dihydroorotate dehydrogenase electron transfer subunit [Candidatus Omnitrophica bacterium]|nr:dihydroorotate dehydrogenase electron transfer subunit [Candidatus Omnitrophota bacterium]
MSKLQNIYKVVSNEKLCPRFFRLCFDAPSIVRKIQPGQFVHIRAHDGLEPFFRRPFSVYRVKKYVEIFYEVVGPGTKLLSLKKKGDPLDVLGPVGRPFAMPPSGTKQVVMIAGGIGVAPFLILSDILRRERRSAFPALELILLYGGRTKGHVFNMKEFKNNGCATHVATDDGSVGTRGRVDKLFAKINPDPKTTFIYTCGPNPMMAAVQRFARQHKIRGQAACEEVMACALGACLGCSIRTTKGFRTVCYDGPTFDLNEVMFEQS